jgi:adenylate kinase
LIDYYGNWAKSGVVDVPQYRKISGLGTVDEIRGRILDALK